VTERVWVAVEVSQNREETPRLVFTDEALAEDLARRGNWWVTEVSVWTSSEPMRFRVQIRRSLALAGPISDLNPKYKFVEHVAEIEVAEINWPDDFGVEVHDTTLNALTRTLADIEDRAPRGVLTVTGWDWDEVDAAYEKAKSQVTETIGDLLWTPDA